MRQAARRVRGQKGSCPQGPPTLRCGHVLQAISVVTLEKVTRGDQTLVGADGDLASKEGLQGPWRAERAGALKRKLCRWCPFGLGQIKGLGGSQLLRGALLRKAQPQQRRDH